MIDQDELTEQQAPCQVVDKWDAERLMRDLRRLRHRIAENEMVVAETQSWCDRENGPLLERCHALELVLAAWMRARVEEDPKAPKSERLPSGEIVSRAGSLKVDVVDEAAFMEWAEKNRPTLVRRPPAPPAVPDKAAIKAALLPACDPGNLTPGMYGAVAEGGEVVAGVVFVREDRQFTIKPAPAGSWMHREEHGE